MNESISAQDEETLKGILKAHAISFGHHVKSVRAEIQNYQKDSSRMATAKISQELEETYDRCSSYKGKNLPVPASCRSNKWAIIGPGSLRRMRDTMTRQIYNNNNNIFSNSGAEVHKHLEQKYTASKDRLRRIIDLLIAKVKRDYHAALIEAHAKQFSEEQLKIKERVTEIIDEAETELQLEELLKDDAESIMSEAEEGEWDRPAMENGDQMDTTEWKI